MGEDAAAVGQCHFEADEDAKADLWGQVEEFYRSGAFCDLRLVCAGGRAVSCHRAVMSCVSRTLAGALRAAVAYEEEAASTVEVPDLGAEAVAAFVDALYGFLARKEGFGEAELRAAVTKDVAAVLCVDLTSAWLPTMPPPPPPSRPPYTPVKVEDIFENDNFNDVNDYVKAEIGGGSLKRGRTGGGYTDDEEDEDEDEEDDEEEDDADWYDQDTKPAKKKRRRRKAQPLVARDEDEVLDGAEYVGHRDEGEERCVELPRTRRSRRARAKVEPTLVERKTPLAIARRKRGTDERVKTPEELYEQMSTCAGTVTVDMQDEPLNVPQHIRAKYRVRTIYQTMMGLRKIGAAEGTYQALPLAWSLLDEVEDVAEQYKQVCRAYIAVLGFSDMEAYYDAQVYSRQGIFRQNNNHKTRYALRKEYAKASREDLEALLRRDDVIAATQRRTPKPAFPVREETVTLELNKDLRPEDLDGIAFLAFFNDGEVSAWVLKVNEAKRQEDTADCVKAAFEIWSRLKKDPKSKYFFMPKSPEMCQIYDHYIGPCETFTVAQEFLKDVDGKHREKLLTKEKQCHECGLVFSLTNINEEQKFINHKRMHYIKNFQCECDVTFKNYPEKKTHFQLYHSDGKFVKCECCSFIANPEAVQRHFEKWHADGANKEYVCPTCGVTAKNKHGYYFHMMTHKEYTCETCGETVTGHKNLLRHRKKNHPQKPEEHPCTQCGKIYASERKLKEHNFRMHVPDKDRPYPCPDCDRGFARSLELSQHRMQAHIRTRPYACRYGCGVAYNDYSSRGVHERKKHGAIFTAAVNTLQAMDAAAAAAQQQQPQQQPPPLPPPQQQPQPQLILTQPPVQQPQPLPPAH